LFDAIAITNAKITPVVFQKTPALNFGYFATVHDVFHGNISLNPENSVCIESTIHCGKKDVSKALQVKGDPAVPEPSYASTSRKPMLSSH